MAGGSNVQLGGLDRWETRTLTVGTTAVRLDSSPLTGRNAVLVRTSTGNTGRIFVGPSSGVSTSAASTAGGVELGKGGTLPLGLSTKAEVWAKGTAASQRASLTEIG